MSEVKFKLGATVSFDDKKEKDILNYLTYLSEHRKLGSYINGLVKFSYEHSDEMRKIGYKGYTSSLSDERQEFYRNINRELNAMSEKVNQMYEMVQRLYIAAEFGKVIGLSEQSSNLMSANVILKQQVKELCNSLGVNEERFLEDRSTSKLEKSYDETMKYITNHYMSEINQMRDMVLVLKSADFINSQIEYTKQGFEKAVEKMEKTEEVETKPNNELENKKKYKEDSEPKKESIVDTRVEDNKHIKVDASEQNNINNGDSNMNQPVYPGYPVFVNGQYVMPNGQQLNMGYPNMGYPNMYNNPQYGVTDGKNGQFAMPFIPNMQNVQMPQYITPDNLVYQMSQYAPNGQINQEVKNNDTLNKKEEPKGIEFDASNLDAMNDFFGM